MHYYKFNIGDYQTHTGHLDPMEDIAYRRMLDLLYLHEKPLPDDVEKIGRLIRMPGEDECITRVLQEFFEHDQSGYFQRRVITEVNTYKKKSATAKKSANKRWSSKHAGLRGDANALRTQSEGNAKHKPLNTNHKPIKRLDQSAPDPNFEKFWNAGMRKIGKKKCEALFNTVLKTIKQPPDEFTAMLATDIHKRLSIDQLGFSEMHPQTYLNGERWNDEVIPNGPIRPGENAAGHRQRGGGNSTSTRDRSLQEDLDDRSWAAGAGPVRALTQ